MGQVVGLEDQLESVANVKRLLPIDKEVATKADSVSEDRASNSGPLQELGSYQVVVESAGRSVLWVNLVSVEEGESNVHETSWNLIPERRGEDDFVDSVSDSADHISWDDSVSDLLNGH